MTNLFKSLSSLSKRFSDAPARNAGLTDSELNHAPITQCLLSGNKTLLLLGRNLLQNTHNKRALPLAYLQRLKTCWRQSWTFSVTNHHIRWNLDHLLTPFFLTCIFGYLPSLWKKQSAVSDTHPVASVCRSCSRLIQINAVELPFTLSGLNGSFGVAHL